MDGGMQGLVGRRWIAGCVLALATLMIGAIAAGSATAALQVGPPEALTPSSVGAPAQIVYAEDGTATVVWGDTGGSPGVKWMRLAADGTPGDVHTLEDGFTSEVHALIDSSGIVTAIWRMNGEAHIARIATDDGVSTPATVPGSSQLFDAGIDQDGRVTVVWTNDGAIQAARYASDGTLDYGPTDVAPPSSGSVAPDIAVGRYGLASVAWEAKVDGIWEAHLVVIADDGTPGAENVLGQTGSTPAAPKIFINVDHNSTVFWSQQDDGGNDLLSKRFNSLGNPSSVSRLIFDGVGLGTPDVVGLNGITVAMKDDQANPSIHVARLGYNGLLIDTRTFGPFNFADDPKLTLDSEDRVTVHFFANDGQLANQRAVRISADGRFGRLVDYDGPGTGSFFTAPDDEFVALGGYGGNLTMWHGATGDPETTIDGGLPEFTSDSTPEVHFSSSEPGANFECSLDGAAFSSCSSPLQLPQLDDGPHSFKVRSTDSDNVTDGSPATATFTVLTATPDTTIDSGPAEGSASRNSTPTFDFSSTTVGAGFECSVDSTTDYQPCGGPWTIGPLADGQHVFRVRAVDQANNVDPTPASRTFTVDRVRPDTSIASGPADGSTVTTSSVTFGLGSNESGVRFECSLDEAEYSACSSPLTLTGLANGAHVLRVRAIDRAGNVDTTPDARSFTVSVAPPPPPGDDACEKAKAKLAKAKAKLKKAKKSGSKAKVKKAKAKVKKAKAAVKKAC
jgi:hypothetical protein